MNDYKAKLDEAMNLLERYNATLEQIQIMKKGMGDKLATAENETLKDIIEAQRGIIKVYETMYKQEDKT